MGLNSKLAPKSSRSMEAPCVDSGPKKRWESVLNNFNLTIVQNVADQLIAQLSSYKLELIQRLSNKYISHLFHPYISEMEGIAKLTNKSFANVVMLNIYFDAYVRGTSIIAKDNNGDILHGRNLDVPFASWLRKIVIVVDYKRNGKNPETSVQHWMKDARVCQESRNSLTFYNNYKQTDHRERVQQKAACINFYVNVKEDLMDCDEALWVELHTSNIVYTGTTFVGYVGLWTGQKPHKFTISANARDYGDWFDHALYFCEDSYPDGWIIRDVLEKADHFLTAYLKLMSTPVLQSIYITLAGIKQGVIIVRDKVTSLQSYYFEPDKWFLLQTDCDKNSKECQNGAGRAAIVNAMNHDQKKNINVDHLFKVFASINGTNVNTAYTTIMCAASPDIYATLIMKH